MPSTDRFVQPLDDIEILPQRRDLGGPGSGNWGHAGRPGEVGGSAGGGGGAAEVRPHFAKLVDQISQPDGGFTAHAVTGEQPKTGFALSIHKGREVVKPAKDLTLLDLATFARDNHDLLSQRDNYFGAWHNPADGQVYLDISRVTQDRAEAERLGREHNQIAYFDLEAGQSVTVMKGAA
jgi:hypothetical protein